MQLNRYALKKNANNDKFYDNLLVPYNALTNTRDTDRFFHNKRPQM